MSNSSKPPKLLHNHFEGCGVAEGSRRTRSMKGLQVQEQDTNSAAWLRLLELVDEAASDGREVFAPAQDLGPEAWAEIVTLPSSISKLKHVKHLQLYGSMLVRIPPAIGEMEDLENFTPYTSYRLHWFPYEITRCQKLRDSTISTRALYGNRKTKKPFPKLPVKAEVLYPTTCSICGGEFGKWGPMQRWTTQAVATDVIPLLVHACSKTCIKSIPDSPDVCRTRPHQGDLQ